VTLLDIDKALKPTDPLLECVSAGEREVLNEGTFRRMIAIERKRTERSTEPFLLMLLEAGNRQGSEKSGKVLDNMLSVLPSSIRETDLIGWYKDRTIVGVMFTGLACSDKSSILSVILGKVSATLRDQLTPDQFNQVLLIQDKEKYPLLRIKQAMDIVGSTLILALCSPLLLIIAVAIKMSSKGPVLFRQQRVGQYGRCFTFLKFRSMHTGNDDTVHKEFAAKLIAGETECELSNGSGKRTFKLTNDKRVTRIGKFLRRSSLDELPQLVNVLKGDMSLVGPRPAIPYEVAAYQTWHRRRVLEVKPGITGLWQVTGRSTVKFDEMVRLDLRYATSWSPLLDYKILMRTPLAVLKGSGAY
jgi:lipopolysaccharide/colanic/teichoic acid biosynthesis glycosyltransferase